MDDQEFYDEVGYGRVDLNLDDQELYDEIRNDDTYGDGTYEDSKRIFQKGSIRSTSFASEPDRKATDRKATLFRDDDLPLRPSSLSRPNFLEDNRPPRRPASLPNYHELAISVSDSQETIELPGYDSLQTEEFNLQQPMYGNVSDLFDEQI